MTTEKERILIVDDEPAIRVFLGEELTQAGYEVLLAASGEEALALLQEKPVDLILLDLKMGGIDGLQVMAELEKQPLPPVVIMLTAHASLDSAVGAMRRGGYDYLTKPCRTEELLASVEKGLAHRREAVHQQELFRLIEDSARQLRATAHPEETEPLAQPHRLEVRGLLLDRERCTVARQGRPVHLSMTEFRLLSCLVARIDQVVAFSELIKELYGCEWEREEDQQALKAHLWRLRKKIGSDPDGAPYIVNVRGQGYKFISEVDQQAGKSGSY
jgi:DNA-binding response OmpR family regulator